MRTFINAALVLQLLFFSVPAFSQKPIAWETEFEKVEKEYLKGDYKKALLKSQSLVKKLEKSYSGESLLRSRALAQQAKVYEGLGKLEEFNSVIQQSEALLNLSSPERSGEYSKALLSIIEAYLQYGKYAHTQRLIDQGIIYLQQTKNADSLTLNELHGKQALVYTRRGYLAKADSMLPAIISFRKSRVVKREVYMDAKGVSKKRKLSSKEFDARVRRVGEAMNLFSLVALENTDLRKVDSLLIAHSGYLRKYVKKKDVLLIENVFQEGLLLEAQKHPATERFETAAKRSQNSKGIRWKPMSKESMRIQEKRITSLKTKGKDTQAKRRRKIYETRISRTYGKKSIYYGRSKLLEAELNIISGNNERAAEKISEVLNTPAFTPEDRWERVRALELMYAVAFTTDQYKEAEKCLAQLAGAQGRITGPDAPATSMYLLDLADFHVLYSNKFKEAEIIYNSHLNRVGKAVDHKNNDYQESLYSFAMLLEFTDQFDEALKVLVTALDDAQKNYGDKSLKYAVALERIANLYIDLGNYSEAEKNLQLADAIFKKEAHASDNIEYSRELQTYARLYVIQGEYDEARTVIRRSMNKQSSAGVERRLTETLDELATMDIETGRYQSTEKYLKESIEVKEAKYGATHRTLVNPLNQLGYLYLLTGNYIEADKCAQRAASISEQLFGKSSLKYAENLKLLGNIYGSIGDYEKSEAALEKALNIQREQYGDKHIQIAASLNDIALIKFYNKEVPEKVEVLLLEALEMTKTSLSDKHPKYASILSSLGMFYLETGALEKSEQYLDKANKIWLERFGENNVHTAEIYFVKGNLSYKRGNFVQARSEYSTSKLIYQREFDNLSHPGYLSALSKVGQMSFIIGDYKGAVRALNETTSSYLSFIQNYFSALSEREKTKFWNKIQKDFEFYNTLMYKLKDEDPSLVSNVYNIELTTKALLLNSSIKVRHRIMESNDPELIRKFEEWTSKKEYMTSAVSMTSEQRKESGIDLKVLETELENLEKELSMKSELFAKNYQKKVYDWKDIRKNLLENEAAVEFVRFRTFTNAFTDTIVYAALIVTPETRSNPEVIFMNNGKEMEQRWLKYYRNCMRFNVEDKQSYENFWKPVKAVIKNNATIYLSPDGVYNQINLETLREPGGSYVLDQNNVILVSNTRDLISRKMEDGKNSKGKTKKDMDKMDGAQIALLGNPLYYSTSFNLQKSASDSASHTEVKRIRQLPGAEQEVKNLNELLSKSGLHPSAFLEDSATEGVVKNLKNIKVFHIATHGFFLEDVESDLEGINQNKAIENPLLRSGLLLKDGGYLVEHDNAYEFNSSEGVLTAYEAMNLNFDQTELVVLSACETGLGKVQLGEGVYGLQRSFLVAGAKSVVMSLFKVSDDVTQELMTLFYQKWIATGDKRQAFIDAKKEIKEKYKNPILWGAFVMIGME